MDSKGQHVTIGTKLKYNLTSHIITIYKELSCNFYIWSLVKNSFKLFRGSKSGKIIWFFKFLKPYFSKIIVFGAFKDKMFLSFN